MKFLPLDRVEKVGGSFQASGVIVAAFKTLAGEERYVFEFDVPKGMLHIYGPNQLEYPKEAAPKSQLRSPDGEQDRRGLSLED